MDSDWNRDFCRSLLLPPGPVLFPLPQNTTNSSPRALLGRAKHTVPVEQEAQLEMEHGVSESSLRYHILCEKNIHANVCILLHSLSAPGSWAMFFFPVASSALCPPVATSYTWPRMGGSFAAVHLWMTPVLSPAHIIECGRQTHSKHTFLCPGGKEFSSQVRGFIKWDLFK